MPARHRTSLGRRLQIILLTAVLVPSLVVAAILIRTGARGEEQEAESALASVTEAVADEMRAFVSDTGSILTSTSVFHAFYDGNKAEQVDTLRNMLARFPYFRSLRVYYQPSTAYSSVTAGTPMWDPPAAVVANGFGQSITGTTYISPVHYTPERRALVFMTVPITRPGAAPVGVIGGVVSLDRVQEIASSFASQNRLGVLIVDRSGRAIALPNSYRDFHIGQRMTGLPPVHDLVVTRNLPALPRSTSYTDPTGLDVLASYERIDGLGWGVVLQQPVVPILHLPYASIALALLWMAGFALFFAVLGRYLGSRVTRPLARLREGAEVIGAGNLDYRVNIRTGDELERVADAFNRTADKLGISYRELEQEHDLAVVAAKQADTLYSVAQALVSTLRLNERLDVIARSLASVCNTDKVMIWLLHGNVLRPTTSSGLTKEEREGFMKWNVHLEEATGITRQVIAGGKPVAIDDADEDGRIPRRVAARFQIKSILALPLMIEDEVTGYAITYVSDRVHHFTEYEITMAKAVAAQAAVAIENARAYERERRISETLQRSFLPQVPPRIGDFEIADMYESAFTEIEIGGDFYDLVELTPTRIAFVMADISGKGLSAAVHTAMIKYTLRAYTLENLGNVEMVRRLNEAVWKFIGGQIFVTLFYGVLDTEDKRLSYVNAGHELPFLFSDDHRVCIRLQTTGTALGIVPEYNYTEESIGFSPGDSLLLYTDGATDVRRDGKFLGEDGLEEIYCGASLGDAHQIVEVVDAGIREYAGGELHDDVALMVIKYRRQEDQEDEE